MVPICQELEYFKTLTFEGMRAPGLDCFQFPQVHQLAQGQLQVPSCASAVLSGMAVLSSLVPSKVLMVVTSGA